MALMKDSDVAVVPTPDNHEFHTQAELQTSTLFNNELDVSAIKFQVDGMPWTIDYFNQILGPGQPPLAPDINIPETTLKYNRIDKLDLYIEVGLSPGAPIDATGTGIINAGFLPYIGDAFVATLAGGRIGILVLTDVRKEHYNTHNIYSVDYKLAYFADTSAAIYNDLVFKTVRTYIYDKTAIDTHSVPVILAKDYTKKMDMAREPKKIISHYMSKFFDDSSKMIRVPTATSVWSDQLVVNAIFKLVSVGESPELATATRLDNNINAVNIWDALFKRDIDLLEICETGMRFKVTPSRNGVSGRVASYLGLSYIICDDPTLAYVAPIVDDNPLSAKKVVDAPITTPGEPYIFSDAFYIQDPNTTFTYFETLVLEYLRGELPNRTNIEKAISEYKYWSYLDQYYLVPILLLLVKTLNSNNYSSL